jgi:hypothetical protein
MGDNWNKIIRRGIIQKRFRLSNNKRTYNNLEINKGFPIFSMFILGLFSMILKLENSLICHTHFSKGVVGAQNNFNQVEILITGPPGHF